MKIIITGSAGFIGYHLALKLLDYGHSIIGIDNLNPYYDVKLKRDRVESLLKNHNYLHFTFDINDQIKLFDVFKNEKPERIIHLAAQAGVRYSLVAPHEYIESNVSGFLNILEACRKFKVEHLVIASTSSVYGANTNMPFSESNGTDHPKSLYAATKKANELMAHSYSHLFNIPTTGLRFFTVYGPWGRPDMAPMIFAKAILEGHPINIHNNGDMKRDFTYIDDIVIGIVKNLDNIPTADNKWNAHYPDPSSSGIAPYKIYNVGNNKPTGLMVFIKTLEETLGKEAIKKYVPMQAGDVHSSWASTDKIHKTTGYKPKSSLRYGIKKFADWYTEYFKYGN